MPEPPTPRSKADAIPQDTPPPSTRPAGDEERRETLKVAFASFDTDGSGCLNVEELAEVLGMGSKLTKAEALEKATSIIGKYDFDGNGTLSIEEFIVWSTAGTEKRERLQMQATSCSPSSTAVEAVHIMPEPPTPRFKADINREGGGTAFVSKTTTALRNEPSPEVQTIADATKRVAADPAAASSLASLVAQSRRQSRIEADVLGIFGTNASSMVQLNGPQGGVKPSAAVRWRQARLVAQQEVFVRRWHKDVDRSYKRLWLGFKDSHSLMSGVFYRGAAGYTRAQTVMVLVNSLALEIVVLCMFYSAPSGGQMVVNPIKIVASGSLCAFICIPAMLVFVWCFTPIIFVRMTKWLLVKLFCWPRALCVCCKRVARSCEARLPPQGVSRRARTNPAAVAPTAEEPAVIGRPVLANDPEHGVAPWAATITTTITTVTTVPHGVTPPPSPPSLSSEGRASETSSAGGKMARRVSIAAVKGTARQEDGAPPPTSRQRTMSRSRSSLQSLLKRSVSRLGRTPSTERTYSYASLNEHLIAQSLTRSWARKEWKAVARILFGWSLNITFFFGLCLCFSLYACQIYQQTSTADIAGHELILSWAFSIFQRFVVNEPALILAGKGLPMLFSTAFCANVCGESMANMLGLIVSGVVGCIKQIRTGG